MGHVGHVGQVGRVGQVGPRGYSISDSFDDGFHVGEILLERAAAGGGQPVFGARDASLEHLVDRWTARATARHGIDRSLPAASRIVGITSMM